MELVECEAADEFTLKLACVDDVIQSASPGYQYSTCCRK